MCPAVLQKTHYAGYACLVYFKKDPVNGSWLLCQELKVLFSLASQNTTSDVMNVSKKW